MDKTVSLSGIVYKTASGEIIVDYGFPEVFNSSSSARPGSVESVSLKDESFCPPIGDTNMQLIPGIDYEGRIVSVHVKNSPKDSESRLKILVKDFLGTLLFRRMNDYWGDDEYIASHYHARMPITVRLDENVMDRIPNAFISKDLRFIPVENLLLEPGDVVSARISTVSPKASIWFNAFRYNLGHQGVIFENRVRSGIYYPGKNVKAQVVDVKIDGDGKRLFFFQLVHEYVEYDGLSIGETYACLISQRDERGDEFIASIKVVVDNLEKNYYFLIPAQELLDDFGGFFPTVIKAKVRVAGFDSIGEPILQFKTLMSELYKQREGEYFDINMVRPYSPRANYRIWYCDDGLCGLVLKSMLKDLENSNSGVCGVFHEGSFYVERKDARQSGIKQGEIIELPIPAAEDQLCPKIHYGAHSGCLCYPEKAVIQANGFAKVIVSYVEPMTNRFVCVPCSTDETPERSFEMGSTVQLQVLAVLQKSIVLGDGYSIGIMPQELWDWSHGLTMNLGMINGLYYQVRVQDIISPNVYALERRSLIDNPWCKLSSVRVGDKLPATIQGFVGTKVLLSIDDVFVSVFWKNISVYSLELGKIRFDKGDVISVAVSEIDVEKRELRLTSVDSSALFSPFKTGTVYDGLIEKVAHEGLVVSVNGVWGFVPNSQMFFRSEYKVGEPIRVMCISKGKNELFFSHLDVIDLTTVEDIHIGDVVNAVYIGMTDDGKWQKYNYGKYVIDSQSWTARYYSVDKLVGFSSMMQPGQRFKLRICAVNQCNIYAVPEQMPDYSDLDREKCYDGVVELIDNGFYMVNVPELEDYFQVLFKDCDWGVVHFETRKVGDSIKVKIIDYYDKVNFPVFSVKACETDPWKDIPGFDTPVLIRNLGSPNMDRDLFVDLYGVPQLLSANAIVALVGKPWVGNAYSYNDLKSLVGRERFMMMVMSFDKGKHTADLMPYFGNPPKIVHNRQIIRNKSIDNGCWVNCGNGLVGFLSNDEVPEGYKLENSIDQAFVKRVDPALGYAMLSIKDLLIEQEEEQEQVEEQPAEESLKGIVVDENTVLKAGMTVRGTISRYDRNGKRFLIDVGPCLGVVYLGYITYNITDIPGFALMAGKEYDFQIHEVRMNQESKVILILNRKSVLPKPDYSKIKEGMSVRAVVKRFSKSESLIVVAIEDLNIEGVIRRDVIWETFSVPGDKKIRYPVLNSRLTAVIQKIERFSSGEVSRVILSNIKT